MPPNPATSPLPSSQEIELETLNRVSVQAPELYDVRSTQKRREQPEGEQGSRPGPPPTDLEIDSTPTSVPDDQPPPSENDETGIPKWPFACLILQHFSSAWTDRTYEFAAYLYLVILFPGSFVPAALLGLLTTATSLVGSGWVGGLVDSRKRLGFVRVSIAVQKASTGASYALFVGPSSTSSSSNSSHALTSLLFSKPPSAVRSFARRDSDRLASSVTDRHHTRPRIGQVATLGRLLCPGATDRHVERGRSRLRRSERCHSARLVRYL